MSRIDLTYVENLETALSSALHHIAALRAEQPLPLRGLRGNLSACQHTHYVSGGYKPWPDVLDEALAAFEQKEAAE